MTVKTQLEAMYRFEAERPDVVWLTQPMGGGVLKDFTFRQAMDEVRRMAAHLKSLGLPEKSNIALFSKNNAWWLLADLAIWMAGHVSVPLYPTLTPETVSQILTHSGARLVFIGKLDGFAAMEPGIAKDLPRIVMPLAPKTDGPKWEDLTRAATPLTGAVERDPKDLATIVYTSGSTGVPKGVMHSFETMLAARAFHDLLGARPDDRMISYLPLAHVAERAIVETGTFVVGFRVYFAESLDTFVEDIKRARPTLFLSVPRLWQKFQSGVFEKMPPEKLARLLRIPLVRSLVRKKVLTALGLAHVRIAGTGSAPIPADLVAWYSSLGLDLVEAYGMTENMAVSHLTRPGEQKPGYIGRVQEGVECRFGEGREVQVKSPGTMLGYYKAPELTAEVLPADGFLKTGDQGEVDEQGRLRITGRVKELFKTSKGKYVAPAPIENRLLAHPDVEQACVSGVNMPQPFGLLVLSPKGKNRATSDATRQALLAELAAYVKTINDGLDHHERLEKLVVLTEEWTIENGLLTPTLKIKRSAIESKYAPRVDAWYAAEGQVLWA